MQRPYSREEESRRIPSLDSPNSARGKGSRAIPHPLRVRTRGSTGAPPAPARNGSAPASRLRAEHPSRRVREMTIFVREATILRLFPSFQPGVCALRSQLQSLFLAAFAMCAAAPVMAAEPTAAGLWQKKDEAGKSVGWFLFVERN